MATTSGRRGRGFLVFVLGFLAGIVVVGAVALFVAMPLAVGHRNNLPLEKLYGDVAVGIASRTGAGEATNPLAGNSRAVQTGRLAYTGSCASCHGANGDGKGVFGQATFPPASDLRGHDTQEKSDAQLFWIIKNGLSFTGMPGFAGQYDDQGLWSLVAYTRALGSGGAGAATVPTPSADHLAVADPLGSPAQRGAAVYFAQACQSCHGPVGNAPGELGLRGGGREAPQAVRQGRPGMPIYGPAQLTDAQLNDLVAYLNTFPANRSR